MKRFNCTQRKFFPSFAVRPEGGRREYFRPQPSGSKDPITPSPVPHPAESARGFDVSRHTATKMRSRRRFPEQAGQGMRWITSLAREAGGTDAPTRHPPTPNLARLHANELPWPQDYDPAHSQLNFYPLLHPEALAEKMAAHYGVRAEEIAITRGSSEGIDCLYRAFARPAGMPSFFARPLSRCTAGTAISKARR